MESKQAVQTLSALAQESRLAIFRLLVQAGPEGLAAGAIGETLGLPPATLSFHLKELTRSGLVTQERSGRNQIYRAGYEEMNALLGYLTANCCEGAACAVETEAADCRC